MAAERRTDHSGEVKKSRVEQFGPILKSLDKYPSKPGQISPLKSLDKVTIAMEMEVSMICPMDVAAFPFDTHICILKFSSFARSPFLESSIPLKSDTLRKSDEMTFVRTSGTDEQPDDRLGRVQDFAVNASYIKVGRFPGIPLGYWVSR